MREGIFRKPHWPSHWLDRIAVFFATGGYSGYLGPIPGTNGSIVGLLLFLPFATCSIVFKLVLTSLICVIGVWASNRAESVINTKDAGEIVIDEIAGMWISVLFLPCNFWFFLGAFLLFRFLDIIKPFPAGRSQRIKGGFGIMVDDVIAGIYTAIILYGAWLLKDLHNS